ncbi:CaiB/BaiF CoA-transferase family protein [Sporichthya sp.]|uniref:CaiB/BaiF CoA transferase family protein n=1 Tax=Sporichthya sp. TaxID=65475 RepID=UPI00180912C9|nr:CaiB/BaiF CoA-transferase family protein [Sporichthya sp.]MBA3744118.1 CoA transferase [Sporichthya sp.]
MSGPLDGLVVVAIEQAVSAPFATRHLGDLGARVIKVERVGGGDFARDYDDEVAGMASHFVWINRNKESLALDFTTESGRAILDELICRADVVVQNLAPGRAAKLGLSASQLVGRHPALIACDVSGYGEGGPYGDRRAYDLVVQAESASIATTGWAERPAKPGIPIADLSAGIYAFSSILAALYQRERSGEGRAIQVSLFDAISEWMGYSIYFTQGSGRRHVPNGVSHPSLSPYEAFATVDGRQVVVAVQNDREWSRMATQVLGSPDLVVDPRFATSAARTAHRAEVTEVCARVLGVLTLDQAIEVLDAAGVACGRVNHSDELLVHPQLDARDRWRQVDSPVGPIRSLLPPPVATGWTPRMDAIPDVGGNTREILRGLGRSEAAITALVAARVVGLAPGESDRTGDRDGSR